MATRALGRPAPNSVAALTAGADRLLGLALIASAGLLALGWLAPMMTVKRLFLFEERISIIDGLITLVEHGEWALFLIVVVFSVLFPAAKLALSYRLWLSGDVRDPRFEARLKRIEGLGKWSMLDVFLVALAVAAIKISVIADVHLHWGLYAFAAGILLSMTAFARLTTIASRLRLGRHGGGRKTRPDA
jgi:paraquat-inducible protein A